MINLGDPMTPARDSYLEVRLKPTMGVKYLWLSDYDKAKDFIEKHLPLEVDCPVIVELKEVSDE